ASAPLGLPASEQLAPVVSLNLDIEPLGRGLDAPPCLVAIGVTDPFDLVEASDGVAHVGSVGERLLARLGEGEVAGGEVVLLGRAQALGAAPHPPPFGPGALGCSGPGEVSSSGLLLLLGCHGRPPERSILVMPTPLGGPPTGSGTHPERNDVAQGRAGWGAGAWAGR